jgi:predicted negative regulator of RcsB-dependent stress response
VEARFAHIAADLSRRRAVRVAGAALLLLGFGSGSLPLLDAPGYELGQLLAFAAVALAPFLALPAARAERAAHGPLASPAAAAGATFTLLSALLALAFAGATLRAALGPCSAVTPASAFVPLLAWPSALAASAGAAAAAFLARGRGGRAALWYVAAVAASLAATLRGGYTGPAAFLFDPFLGAFPGPLYDEALRVDGRLVLQRLEAAALGVALAAAAELVARLRGPPPRARAVAPALVLAVALGAAAGGKAAREAQALDGDRASIAEALGDRREGARCTVVLPAEKAEAAKDAFVADCDFHVDDVSRALGVAAPPRLTVYLYRSAAEKRRLVGAGATEYAKPWLAEVHVADAPLPHPVLRHEVAHAVAATLAGGPLRIPARGGVLVAAGLLEGLAVALELPRGGWTVHEWARAARDLGYLPDAAKLMSPASFWTQAPARAYGAAGSFVAFVLERYGGAPVREAYRTGDLGAAAGKPVEALAAEWQVFLDGVAVPDGLRLAAQARFGRKSLFARRCAREAAVLVADGALAAAGGRLEKACDLYARAAELGDRGQLAKAIGDLRARALDLDGAEERYEAALAAADPEDRALRVAVTVARGDLAWRRGDAAAASAAYRAALASGPDDPEARLLHAKLAALADPALGAAARPYLLGEGDAVLALARLSRSGHPLAAYLVARALLQRGEARAALDELARADAPGLPDALRPEARFLAAEARCLAGEEDAGAAALSRIAADATRAADRLRAEAGLRRCAFERSRP